MATVKISMLGDIMCTQQQIQSRVAGASYDDSFEYIQPLLEGSDFTVANLETPVAGVKLNLSDHPWSFNTTIDFARSVKKSGVDLVSTANNHALDRGVDGLDETMKNLNKIKLPYIGTRLRRADSPHYIRSVNGIKIGFLSYTYGTNASFNKHYLSKDERYKINLFQRQEPTLKRTNLIGRIAHKLRWNIFNLRAPILIANMLREVRGVRQEGADVIVMCLHAGGQRNNNPERFTKWISAKLTRAGVDIVNVCHEHVVHPVDITNSKVHAYSLGNSLHHPEADASYVDKEVSNLLRADYSIILHCYVDRDEASSITRMTKTTFTIVKNVLDSNNVVRITPAYTILDNPNLPAIDRNKIIGDIRYIISKVTGDKQYANQRGVYAFQEHDINQ